MGRARRRARRLAGAGAAEAPGTGRSAPGGAPAGRQPDARRRDERLSDPDWRRAERRRIARLNRLPDPLRSWGDRSRAHGMAVAVLQVLLAVTLTLPVLRLVSGSWLPPYAAVVALAVAVALQAVCRSVNRRADARAAGR